MIWKAYRVVLQLKSPIHIGCGKVGNVQRTRPYVTGRSFWGALTMRLTREQHHPATDSALYQAIGQQAHEQLAYTYFYPATKSDSDYQIHFSWQDGHRFQRQLLSSYASTALVYPQQAADEGLLHEVEFLSPRTLDEGKQVYLIGCVFEKEGCTLNWQDACNRMQIGGERGYGWGDVKCINAQEITDAQLFNSNCHWSEHNGSIQIQLTESSPLLAHAIADTVPAQGEIELLVGREWRSRNSTNRYAGQHVEQWVDNLCWVPGSVMERSQKFVIGNFGIWQSSR